GSYEISPSDIVHLGDGRWNDVTMARQAGCPARWVDHAAPTRFERALAEGGVIGAAVAGAARQARLDLEAGEPEHHRLERLGADVAGGAFSAFLLWLRQQVEAEGLGQVAFLARDGRLLHDMAHDMASDHWEGFDLHYLRASRRAWLLAAASAVGVHEWIEVGCRTPDAFIHHSRHDIPFRSLLARIGLDPDDLDQHPELAALDPGRPLPPRLVPAWEAMLGHDTIAQAIGHRSTARRELILDHLADLGLPPAPFAVVDVGWKGQFGWLVGSVLSAHTGHRCVHFHIGGDQVVPDLEQLVEIRRFAFNDLERPHPFH
ncbi:MAG: hypothetical protein GY929_10210, partial [Actinomycetia bacterium]|nr:hypothetical protein [Actinomycetes bacterium]